MGQILYFWIFTVGLLGCAASRCPNGWLRFNNSCYLFGNDEQDFVTAEHFCGQHKAHLVHVETAQENFFIKDWLRRLKPAHWWIGMTDSVIENIWVWTETDEPVKFTDWHAGQPDDLIGHQDCGLYLNDFNFDWDDNDCTLKFHAICERSDDDVEMIVG